MTEEEIQSYENMNKGSDSPWELEPNEFEFTHLGYECSMRRSNSGTWLGYIEKKPNNSKYVDAYIKKHKLDDDESLLEVHGGITYASATHYVFDCSHAGDFTPARFDWEHDAWRKRQHKLMNIDPAPDVYRTFGYVVRELCNLAQQLEDIKYKALIYLGESK